MSNNSEFISVTVEEHTKQHVARRQHKRNRRQREKRRRDELTRLILAEARKEGIEPPGYYLYGNRYYEPGTDFNQFDKYEVEDYDAYRPDPFVMPVPIAEAPHDVEWKSFISNNKWTGSIDLEDPEALMK